MTWVVGLFSGQGPTYHSMRGQQGQETVEHSPRFRAYVGDYDDVYHTMSIGPVHALTHDDVGFVM